MADNRTTIEALEAKRAERKAATEKAREAQYAQDLEWLDGLEVEHGDGRVTALRMSSYVPGLPTLVVVKAPEPSYFARFRQQVRKAGQRVEAIGDAKDMLATACLAYPDAEVYGRMCEAWASLHDAVGVEAIRLAETEGKG